MTHLGRLTLFIGLICLMGCEEPVDLDLPVAESKIAITSEFAPDRPFKVYVSNSVSSTSNQDIQMLTEADVTISKGDRAFELLQLVRDEWSYVYYYLGRNKVDLNNLEYSIEVKAPGYPTTTATDVIPSATPIQSFEILMDERKGPTSEIELEFDLNFKVHPMHDYYHLVLYYKYTSIYPNPPHQILSRNNQELISLEDMPGNPRFLRHFSKGILLKSSNIESDIASLKFKTSFNTLSNHIDRSLVAELRTVSDDYYLFHSSFTRQLSQSDSIIGQPIVLHNNVKNGLGSFAAYNYTTSSIPLD